MGLRSRLIAAARAGFDEFMRPSEPAPQISPSPLVGNPGPGGLVAAPAADVYQPPSMDPRPSVRIVHKDVGKKKEGPIAYCTGKEYDVVCSDEWLTVSCAACHARRHPQAPLSRDELSSGTRATGPDASRPLTRDEIDYDRKHRDPYWDR